jgi:Methyltransferase domain
MSPLGFLRRLVVTHRIRSAQREVLRNSTGEGLEAALADWSRSLHDPTGYYLDCFRYFHHRLPEEVRVHREWFASGRGFGEDAFHTMWAMLFEKLRIVDYLEIGVYRGQVLTLAALLQRRGGIKGNVTGISPFEAAGDSVTRYPRGIDYLADTRANFAHFQLPPARLIKAYSTDPKAVEVIRKGPWDCVYIDGNHDYEIVQADWKASCEGVRPTGVIVLDDAALGTDFEPPAFATKGHPGPSRLAGEIDQERFPEILRVGHNRVFQRRE